MWEVMLAERFEVPELVDQFKVLLDSSPRPQGYNLGFNVGNAAGLTVDQLHVHVIARYDVMSSIHVAASGI